MIEFYLKAGFPILAIFTSELERAQEELMQEVISLSDINGKSLERKSFTWTCLSGGKQNGLMKPDNPMPPMDAINFLNNADPHTVLFVWNFHPYLKNPDIIQGLLTGKEFWKSDGRSFVFLSPPFQIPIELDKAIHVEDFALPDREKLKHVLENIKGDLDIGEFNENEILTAATGLTRFEAENAFSLSLSKKGTIDETCSQR